MQDDAASRAERFESSASLPSNRYMAMKRVREDDIRKTEEEDLHPRALTEAVTIVGTCMDMCPEFEREEREYQNNVDRLEMLPQQPGQQRRIDHKKAVKAFARPAAGNQVQASDIRPPHVLKRTLDYLFNEILAKDPDLTHCHPFLRDRTRAIRKDLVVQHEKGLLAIEINERIARFHAYSLHKMRGTKDYSENQEREQFSKVLKSLTELYDDARHTDLAPHIKNEAEFRSYYLLIHLRDPEALRQAEFLSPSILFSPPVQQALRLRALAQRNNAEGRQASKSNSPSSTNGFSRFFKLIARPSTSFLQACILQLYFHDIREAALKALRSAYRDAHASFPIDTLTKILGCDDEQDCANICEFFGVDVIKDQEGNLSAARLVRSTEAPEDTIDPGHQSRRLVPMKATGLSILDIVNGTGQPSSTSLVPLAAPKTKPSAKSKGLSATASAFTPTKRFMPQPAASSTKPAFSTATAQQNFLVPQPFSAFATPSQTPSPAPSPQFNLQPGLFSFGAAPKAPSTSSAAAPTSQPPAPQIPSFPAPSLGPPVTFKATPPIASTSKSASPPPPPQSARKPSFTTPAPHSPTAVRKQKPKPAYQDPALLIQSIAAKITQEMFDSHAQSQVQLVAAEVLAQQQRKMDQEARKAEDDMCRKTAESLITGLVWEEVATIALQMRADQHRQRSALKRWRSAKKAHQAHFAEMSRAEALGPRDWEEFASTVTATSHHLQNSSLTEDFDMDSSMAMDLAQQKRDAFWTADSFAQSIQLHTEPLFAHAPHNAKPAWDVFVSLGENVKRSTMGTWYRHKLGIDPDKTQSTQSTGHVDISIRLLDLASSFKAALKNLEKTADHVGLVVFDTSGDEVPSRRQNRFDLLSQRVLGLSKFNPALLFVAWPKMGETSAACLSRLNATITLPKTGFSTIAWLVVDPAKIDERFDRALSTLLSSVQLNRQSLSQLSVHSCAKPFIETWHTNWQTMVNHPHFSLDTKPKLPGQAITSIVDVVQQLELGAYRQIIQPDISFDYEPRSQSLRQALGAFVSAAKLDEYFDVALVDTSDSRLQLLLLGGAIARSMNDRTSRSPFEVTEAFGRIVQDQAKSFEEQWQRLFVEAAQLVKTPKKRPAANGVIDLTNDSSKRVKSTNNKKTKVPPKWRTKDMTDLEHEMKAARELMSNIRTITIDDSDDET